MNWTETIERYIAEGRTVSGGKGDSVAKQAETQSMDFQSQLMQIFQKQFGQQTAVLNFLKAKLMPMISNPTGYSPQALAALRSGALDTITNQEQMAQKALQNQEFEQGGRQLPSGVNEQLNASLLNSAMQQKAGALNNITLANEELKQKNFWNATSELAGTGQLFNPASYAGEANAAGGTTAGLSNAYSNSQNAGFGGAFSRALGNTLGGGNFNVAGTLPL